MRTALRLLALAALFAAGPIWLDERLASYGGVLPLRDLPTRASSNEAESGLAIDLAPQTAWTGEVHGDAYWQAFFPEPIAFAGVHVDTGDDWRTSLRPRLATAKEDFEHRRIFSCWRRLELKEPVVTSHVTLLPVPGKTTDTGRWALRDVRVLVAGDVPFDVDAYLESLPRLLLPFLLAALWVNALGRSSRAPPCR